MASGYTSILTEKNLTFEEFAILCARAFGICMSMRDDPLDIPPPEKIKPISTYHKEALAECKRKLKKLSTLVADEARERWARNRIKKELAVVKKCKKEADEKNLVGKYNAMLTQVHAWEPPTKDHEGLKKFMEDQLTQSIQYDGHSAYYEKQIVALEERLTKPLDYYDREVEDTVHNIKYHAEKWKEEVESAERATRWLQDLRASLKVREKEAT